jgi:hypothetical protein
MNIPVFWDVTPCSSVEGTDVSAEPAASKTLAPTYKTTLHHNPEDKFHRASLSSSSMNMNCKLEEVESNTMMLKRFYKQTY